MKRTLIAAATVLTLASPALAMNGGAAQLAAELGVAPGQFTLAQLVQLKNASEKSGNDAVVVIDGVRIDTQM